MPGLSPRHQLPHADTGPPSLHPLRWQARPLRRPRGHRHAVRPWGHSHDRPGGNAIGATAVGAPATAAPPAPLAQSQRSLVD
jgi:hypothetical protein